MSVNWEMLWSESGGCKDMAELEKVMVKCGVGKGDVFRVIRSSVGGYSYGRKFRSGYNKSVKEMRKELEELRSKVGK